MDKYFISLLTLINENKKVNPIEIEIDNLNYDETWNILVEMYYLGYVHLSKDVVYTTNIGRDYLRDQLPMNTPATVAKITNKQTIQYGTNSKSVWAKEFMLAIIYPLLVLLIGTIILKILGVI